MEWKYLHDIVYLRSQDECDGVFKTRTLKGLGMELLPYYIAGLPFAFYLLARWTGKESAWLEDSNGLQTAYISLLWPLIAMGVVIWCGIDCLFKAIEMICKPFLKAYIWCNSWPHPTKKLERFGFTPTNTDGE